MSPEKVIYTLLAADAPLAGLVSTRIYQDARPEEDALPAAIVALVSDVVTGRISDTPGNQLYVARVEVIGIAQGSAAAKQIADAAMAALNYSSGVVAGVTVVSIIATGRGPGIYDGLTGLYTQPADFLITYYR